MTRYLIDTHVFLWLAAAPEMVRPSTLRSLESPGVELRLSMASLWEMFLKASLGRLELPPDLAGDAEALRISLEEAGFSLLPIELAHLTQITDLPFHHRDPFDRLLIAQAMVEGLTLVSRDAQFAAYDGVTVLTA